MAETKQRRGTAKLAAISLKNLPPGMHGDGGGLWLQVTANGRSWIYRYTFGGRSREMGLGSLTTIGLAEARKAAAECRELLRPSSPTTAPIDPIEYRRGLRSATRIEAARSMTFRQCAEAYIATHRAGWRNAKHAAQWPSTLRTYVYPVFGDLPVEAIDTALVRRALEPIWTTKPESASRIRGRIESILDWAKTAGYRDGDNPARWRGHLANVLVTKSSAAKAARRASGKGEHHAALPYSQIGAFMAELRGQEGVAARALEFLILTAGRTNEIIGARWSEFNDLAERIWTVPAERMKTDKEHRVPLSSAALHIIEQMEAIRDGDYVFPGMKVGRPLSNMAMLMLLRRMGRGDLTAHGFRSTFRDWAADCTDFPRDIAEMALAHTVGDKVEAAYRRGDGFQKRLLLAEEWAAYCDQGTTGLAADNAASRIVRLRQQRIDAA